MLDKLTRMLDKLTRMLDKLTRRLDKLIRMIGKLAHYRTVIVPFALPVTLVVLQAAGVLQLNVYSQPTSSPT